MACRELLLVRHCQSSGPAPDAELTELGLRQAHTLAAFLSDMEVDLVVSSAYKRAQQSVESFAAALGATVRIDHRLCERTLSDSPIDRWRELIRDSFEDLELRASGGESAREVLDRAWASLNDLLYSDYQLPLAVMHGNLISLILNSLDPSFGYRGWEQLSNPDVFVLRESEDGQVSFERLWDG